MARQGVASMFAAALVLGVFASSPTMVQSIGVCYGNNGDNLPSPSAVVQLYQSNSIGAMRIYAPDSATLQALSGTGIGLILDIGGTGVLASLASDPSAAATWVQNNVQPYSGVSFRYITVGNEVTGGDTQNILPAMQNINNALSSAGLGNIKVSTAVKMDAIANSYPPSHGVFADSYMTPIVQYLASTGAPLLANVYPYFAYAGSNGQIDLNYALFTSPGTVVQDPDSGLNYQNLFDAMVDAIYSALEKAGGSNVPIVVSESGWPSDGGTDTTPGNAQTYNQNLINHVGQGTPKRPGGIETYIFAMFNEDQKAPGIEQHWGLFNPNEQPVYPINFN